MITTRWRTVVDKLTCRCHGSTETVHGFAVRVWAQSLFRYTRQVYRYACGRLNRNVTRRPRDERARLWSEQTPYISTTPDAGDTCSLFSVVVCVRRAPKMEAGFVFTPRAIVERTRVIIAVLRGRIITVVLCLSGGFFLTIHILSKNKT